MKFIILTFFTFSAIVAQSNSPCEHEIFNIALEKGKSNLSSVELELYNAMTQLCENNSIGTSSDVNKVPAILSKLTLFCDLNSVLNSNAEYAGNFPPFDLIGFEIALNKSVSVGLGYGKSSFSGRNYDDTLDVIDSEESYTQIAIGGLYRLGYLNLGGLYIKDTVKIEANDPDGYYLYDDYDATRTIMAPFIGCELPISDDFSLELRNYFNLIFFDVEINDYEEKATSQSLYLKFSI